MTRHNLDKLSLYDSDVHASDGMIFFSDKFENTGKRQAGWPLKLRILSQLT